MNDTESMMEKQPPTFLQLVDRLTRETPATVQREHGTEIKQQMGLLLQLREALFGGMEGTGGGAGFGSKPPIDASALDLLDEITNQATQALAAVTHTPTPYGQAEHYVRLWAGQTKETNIFTVTAPATSDTGTVFDQRFEYTALALVFRWVERIEGFFNPASSKEIPSPCPQCDERYTYRMKDGELIRSGALSISIDKRTGISRDARCSGCGASWARSQFEVLAKMVGAKPVPELVNDTLVITVL